MGREWSALLRWRWLDLPDLWNSREMLSRRLWVVQFGLLLRNRPWNLRRRRLLLLLLLIGLWLELRCKVRLMLGMQTLRVVYRRLSLGRWGRLLLRLLLLLILIIILLIILCWRAVPMQLSALQQRARRVLSIEDGKGARSL